MKNGPTAIERALCKVRKEQECAKRKLKPIVFPSPYARFSESKSRAKVLKMEVLKTKVLETKMSSTLPTSFLDFMQVYCGEKKKDGTSG